LGIVPKLNNQKKIVFTSKPQGLFSLFLKGLNDTKLLQDEKEALNVLLRISSGYVSALKDRTESNILNSLNGYLTQNKAFKAIEFQTIVNKEMDKAKKHFELISNAESNKSVNFGTALQINRIAQSKGEEEPICFFVVTQDDKTGPYEYILHLLPDRVTPRVWKLSEIQSDYYKPGGQYPSLAGLHVNCFTREQKLFTNRGLITFGELFESQCNPEVLVDYRVRNTKYPANQFGKEIEGSVWFDSHSKQKDRFLPLKKCRWDFMEI
jgi:hypothetical protein